MRIAIVAEHASARFGGEAFLPLHYFRTLRQRGHDVHLICHSRARAEIQERFPHDAANLHFVEDSWLHRLLFRLGKMLPRKVEEITVGLASQLHTQGQARRIVRRLHAVQPFDVVHQPIPVSPKFPSRIHGLGAPVVIGPLNGGMEYPPGFSRYESPLERAVLRAARRLSEAVHWVIPGKRRAALILVANERTRRALPTSVNAPVRVLVENAVDLSVWEGNDPSPHYDPRTFVFVGRLVDWKAVDLAIRALAATDPDLRLRIEIVGDGPERESLRRCAAACGVADRVLFTGFLSQPECAIRLRRSCGLLLPSLFECGGAVVLEAMAAGCPAIASHWGGPADYLDATCGILVEPRSEQAVIDGFASSMMKLATQPPLRRSLARHARLKAEQVFSWEAKAREMESMFEQLILSGSPRTFPAQSLRDSIS